MDIYCWRWSNVSCLPVMKWMNNRHILCTLHISHLTVAYGHIKNTVHNHTHTNASLSILCCILRVWNCLDTIARHGSSITSHAHNLQIRKILNGYLRMCVCVCLCSGMHCACIYFVWAKIYRIDIGLEPLHYIRSDHKFVCMSIWFNSRKPAYTQTHNLWMMPLE